MICSSHAGGHSKVIQKSWDTVQRTSLKTMICKQVFLWSISSLEFAAAQAFRNFLFILFNPWTIGLGFELAFTKV